MLAGSMKTLAVFWIFGFGLMFVTVRAFTPKICEKENLDIFVVLDGSRSVRADDFERIKDFLSDLVTYFKVGKLQTRIGLMQFSERRSTVIEFNFGEHTTTESIQQNINRLIHHNGSSTYTGNALKIANEKIFNGRNGKRRDAEQVLLLITDGLPHDMNLAIQEANKLKKKDVHIITIGVGSEKWINQYKWELSRLGSKPTHNHRVRYKNLKGITRKLVENICNSKKRQPAPPHKCFQEKQDILIMVDGSKFIGRQGFSKIKTFLRRFVSRLDIGPEQVHVALIQFSSSSRTDVEISLNSYFTTEDLLAAIAKVHYQEENEADLAYALRMANSRVFNGRNGDRLSAPDMIIIFTDGSYKGLRNSQQTLGVLRKKGTRVISIAVEGRYRSLNQKKIDGLASNSGDVYHIDAIQGGELLDELAPTTCEMVFCTTGAPKCRQESQDILILIDGSSKIGSAHFKQAKRFVARLVRKMTIGKNQTHVGVIQYAGTGDLTHDAILGKDFLRGEVAIAVAKMRFKDAKRNSDLVYALSVASDELLRGNPSRKSVGKVLMIITDGDIADFTEANIVAENLKNKGVRVIAISNGRRRAQQTFVSSLRLLATGPKEYYTLGNSFNEIYNEVQKSVCISEALLPESCFKRRRNIFFLLDSSHGRGKRKFREVKNFMENLLKRLHIGPSQTHVGFLQYDEPGSTKNAIIFNKDDTSYDILWQIRNMWYRSGETSYLGEALKKINNEVFIENNDQHPDYEDVLIIISHRNTRDAQLAFEEAEKLKSKGVHIIPIATGKRETVSKVKSELQVISSSPSNIHTVDYKSLWSVVDEVLVDLCGLGKCPALSATTCTPEKQDIVFAIDGSRSIGDHNFFRLQRFAKRLAARLDLASNRTHMGLIQVGSDKNAKFQFNLGEFPDREDVLYMIEDMTYLDDDATFFGNGLRKIRTRVFNRKAIDRSSVPNTLVLFTDGESHDSHLMFKEAERLKANGVKILSVGFGSDFRLARYRESLVKLASKEKDVFTIDFKKNDLVLEEKISTIAQHLVKVKCPQSCDTSVTCVQSYVDLFLLVDGSRSINKANFRLVKRFLKKLMSEFDLGHNKTRVGLLQFSDSESLSYEFGLSQGFTTKQARRAIKRMEYKAGSETRTGEALQIVDLAIFKGQDGDRPDVPNVLLLFTDGAAHDTELAKKHAAIMKERKIRIIVIAAGDAAKNLKFIADLEEIATSPLDVYKSDFQELPLIADKLINIDCVMEEVESCPEQAAHRPG